MLKSGIFQSQNTAKQSTEIPKTPKFIEVGKN